ncbi:MAG TPA: selenocysteine-specific translation elongation factor [Vicinamibacteria bacterium]|nr:selenocysteine-specific translation elongation factor [Vicinamibacteria bacterium]
MRSLIVGTAGHIDHGKSALVRALTGTDPDRLKEEKERGITIDLGFAHLDLGPGRVASFIDVPGHERFVRNMLAGAHGIDAVLLVVAADESVMPQTREHFHICRLLGIERGAVVLTKCDVADEESQTVAEMEARELVAGSFLEAAPVLRVSARTGEGLDDLRGALRALAGDVAERPAEGILRLPVDRAFTLRGFGTVVTGTLVSGAVAVGDDVELMPSGRRSRVRGLQVHGRGVDRVGAGNRAAVNLPGLEVAHVARGDVLARPGTLRASRLLDVEIALLPGERPLRDLSRVRVHLASAELLGRVRLLDGAGGEEGRAARAQLRMEAPAVAGRGDRLVLRSYSPAATIGGAVVLDPFPPPRRRRDALLSAAVPAGADAATAARALVQQAGTAGLDTPTLAARLTVPPADVPRLVAGDALLVAVGREPVWYVARAALEALAAKARVALERFHAGNPLRPAMPREELRRRVFGRAPAGAFERVLETLVAAKEAALAGEGVALTRHAVRLSPQEEQARGALLTAARAAGLEGVDLDRVAAQAGAARPVLERVVKVLLAEGELRRVGEGLVHAGALDLLKAQVRERWPPGSRLDVGAFKDLTGLSRKFTIPLLEYLDRERVTRRSGNDRLVLS